MVKRNEHLAKLTAGYLFPEIKMRKKRVMEKHPEARIISLGIGNTTEPLTPYITKKLAEAAQGMGTIQGYSGYGDEQGMTELRKKIAEVWYKGKVKPEEVFISDGAKCDIGRLQLMFGDKVTIAVQDPSYPVYVDGSVLIGCTGKQQGSHFKGITYLTCAPENHFFPELKKADIIYFCSPNNPTGAVATKEQLKTLVRFALANKSFVIFDAAYAAFISDASLPKSIYEIEDAKECCIEVNSLSKPVGFTGLRLGWSVVPERLKYDSGESVHQDWNRIMTTLFNGASNVVQKAGLAVFDNEGKKEMKEIVDYYMKNAATIKKTLDACGIDSYGGVDAPYLWLHFPGKKSWDVFESILEGCFVVTTPGSGFGPAGEGFLRLSAFGHAEDVQEACKRLKVFFRRKG